MQKGFCFCGLFVLILADKGQKLFNKNAEAKVHKNPIYREVTPEVYLEIMCIS